MAATIEREGVIPVSEGITLRVFGAGSKVDIGKSPAGANLPLRNVEHRAWLISFDMELMDRYRWTNNDNTKNFNEILDAVAKLDNSKLDFSTARTWPMRHIDSWVDDGENKWKVLVVLLEKSVETTERIQFTHATLYTRDSGKYLRKLVEKIGDRQTGYG